MGVVETECDLGSLTIGLLIVEDVLGVAGEHDDRRDGTLVKRYSRNNLRSSSVKGEISDVAIVKHHEFEFSHKSTRKMLTNRDENLETQK